jgi:hypothetical protein
MIEQQPDPGPDGLIGKTVGDYIVRYKLGEGATRRPRAPGR